MIIENPISLKFTGENLSLDTHLRFSVEGTGFRIQYTNSLNITPDNKTILKGKSGTEAFGVFSNVWRIDYTPGNLRDYDPSLDEESRLELKILFYACLFKFLNQFTKLLVKMPWDWIDENFFIGYLPETNYQMMRQLERLFLQSPSGSWECLLDDLLTQNNIEWINTTAPSSFQRQAISLGYPDLKEHNMKHHCVFEIRELLYNNEVMHFLKSCYEYILYREINDNPIIIREFYE